MAYGWLEPRLSDIRIYATDDYGIRWELETDWGCEVDQ